MLFAFGIGLPEILIILVGLAILIGVTYFIYRAGVSAGLAKARREQIEDRLP